MPGLLITKFALSFILITGMIVELWTISTEEEVFYISELFAFVCLTMSYVIMMCLEVFIFRHHVTSSPISFLFWLSMLVCQGPNFKLQITELMANANAISIVLVMTQYPCMILQFCLSFCSPFACRQIQATNTEDRASFASILFYSWLDKLIWRTYKHPLNNLPLPKPSLSLLSEKSVGRFLPNWNKNSCNFVDHFDYLLICYSFTPHLLFLLIFWKSTFPD